MCTENFADTDGHSGQTDDALSGVPEIGGVAEACAVHSAEKGLLET